MPDIHFGIKVDTQGAQQGVKQAEGYIEDAKKRLKSGPGMQLTIDLAKLKGDLVSVNSEIKRAIKAGDVDRVLRLRVDQVGLSKEITLANKALTNFINTGNQNVSVLGKLFQSVSIGGSKLGGLLSIFGGGGGFASSLSSVAGSAGGISGALGGLGGSIAGITGPAILAGGAIVGLGAGLAKASSIARSFEDAWAGVAKTVDGTPEQLAGLRKELIDLSKRIPVPFEDLSRLATVAGAMGVPIENIAKFTEVTAKLNTAVDGISGEDAVTALVQIGDQTGETYDNIDRMASAVVRMGNDFAGTEGQILDFAGRLSKFVGPLGVTYSQVIGISTAMTAMGINAELGSTAMGSAFGEIELAVSRGSKELDGFAKVSGLSAKEFATLWEKDASGAFTKFVQGLGKVSNQTQVIDELFGSNSRIRLSLNALASDKGFAILTDALQKAQEEMENTGESISALDKEFEKRTETLSSRLQVMKNKWASALEPTGKFFNNFILKPLAEFVGDMGIMLGQILGLVGGAMKTLFDLFYIPLSALPKIAKASLNLIKLAFDDLGKNLLPFVQALGRNIGIALGNVGPVMSVGLNLAKKSLELFLNAGIGLVNDFLKKVGSNSVAEKLGLGFLKDKKINDVSFKTDFSAVGKIKDFEKMPDLFGGDTKKQFDELIAMRNKVATDLGSTIKGNFGFDLEKDKLKAENQEKTRIAQKMAEERMQLEDEAQKKGASKALKNQEELLKKKAEKEIKAIEASELSEEEKAEKIKAIQDKLEEDITKLKKTALDESLKNNDKYIDNVKKTTNSIDDQWEDSIKKVGDYSKKLEDLSEKFDELKENALEDIRDINNELGEIGSDKKKLDQETFNKLAENRVKLLEEQAQLQRDLAKEDDFERQIELQQKLAEIAREIASIEANVPADIIRRAEELARLTDTERTLLELKEKQAELDAKSEALIQKKLVADAVANGRTIDIGADGKISVEDEKGKMVEITDFKAQEYARDSANKILEITSQQEAIKKLLDDELAHLADIDAQKREIEKSFSTFFAGEIDARNAKLREYVQQAQQAALALQKIGLERQAQEAQAVTNSTVLNNSNKSVNQTFNVGSSVDAESLGRSILKKI